MAFWDSLISAVKSYFTPAPVSKPAAQPSPAPKTSNNYVSTNPALNKYASSAIKNTPTPKTSGSSGGNKSGGSSGGGSSSGSLPSSGASTPTPGNPSILSTGASTIAKEVQRKIGQIEKVGLPATVLGGLGKAGTAVSSAVLGPGAMSRLGPGNTPFFEEVQNAMGTGDYGKLWKLITGTGEALTKPGDVSGRTLQQSLPVNVPPAARGGQKPLPTAQSATGARQGSIVAPAVSNKGVPAPATSPANLPANMQGLNQSNVNPALAQNMTPEAVQSIGQLLLRSLLGNQSALTGLNPGIAQALWGAPTMGSSFGGYDGGMTVPDQTRVQQPANLPPIPQPIAQG